MYQEQLLRRCQWPVGETGCVHFDGDGDDGEALLGDGGADVGDAAAVVADVAAAGVGDGDGVRGEPRSIELYSFVAVV